MAGHLLGWTRKTEELPKIYSKLHTNILDEFHGHQVEITSPAFRAILDALGMLGVANPDALLQDQGLFFTLYASSTFPGSCPNIE